MYVRNKAWLIGFSKLSYRISGQYGYIMHLWRRIDRFALYNRTLNPNHDQGSVRWSALQSYVTVLSTDDRPAYMHRLTLRDTNANSCLSSITDRSAPHRTISMPVENVTCVSCQTYGRTGTEQRCATKFPEILISYMIICRCRTAKRVTKVRLALDRSLCY